MVLDASPNAYLQRGTSLVRAMSQYPGAAAIRADEAFYDARWHEIIENLLNVSDRVEDAVRGIARGHRRSFRALRRSRSDRRIDF